MLTLCSIVLMLSTSGGSTVLLIPRLLMAAVHAVERISVSTDSAKTIHQSHPESVSSTVGTSETGERKGLMRVLVFEKHSYSVGSNGIDLCYLKAMGHPVRKKTFFLRL